MIDWFKKRKVFPRWRLMGILIFAILFGMTLQNSMQGASYWFPIAVVIFGINFLYEK